MAKAKVLFLCTGNSARSQMGEALLRHYAGDYFDVYSAGIEPKGLNPYTRRVMKEMGLPLDGQRSKSVQEYLGRINFGYLITGCSEAEEKCPTTFLGVSQRLHWPFEDPARFEGPDAEKLARFREVRDQIASKVKAWLAELKIPAQEQAASETAA